MCEKNMIEIRDLTEKNVDDIATFCSLGEVKNDFYLQGEKRKKKFLLEKLKKGGRAKIAYKENESVVFIEYYLIEDAPMNITGKDIMIIPCMNVKVTERKKRIGEKLLRASIEATKKMGKKAIAVIATEWEDFMPKAFFEKNGFENVTNRSPINIFMKKLDEVENPQWLKLLYKQKPVKGKLVIDIFHTDQCPFDWQNTQRVKKVAREFGDSVVVTDFDTNKRENILKYGTQGAIIVNKEYLGTGPPLSEEEIRKVFKERLKATK